MLKNLLALTALSLGLAGCSVIGSHSSNTPCEIGSLNIISGDNQSGVVGDQLVSPVTAQLLDKCGVPVANSEIQVTSPDIDLNQSSNVFTQVANFISNGFTNQELNLTTNDQGQISFTVVMPEQAGNKSLVLAHQALINPVTMSFKALTAPPKILSIYSGNQQNLVAGTESENLEVLVTDKFNNPVQNVVVAFSSSSGTLSNSSAITNEAGLVAARIRAGNSTAAIEVVANIDPTLNANSVTFNLSVNPTEASAILKIAGDAQTGNPGQVLPTTLKARVIDNFGNPLPGQLVSFSSSFGNSTVSPDSATTNSLGEVETVLTLGSASGLHIIKASVANGKEAQFLATVTGGTSGTPDPNGANVISLQAVSGQSQSANVNSPLPLPIRVRLVDSSGSGVANTQVNFYSSPSATLATPSVNTDASGYAQTNVTLGSTSGNYIITATASVSGNNNVIFTASANVVVGPSPTPGPTATPVQANITSLALVDGSNQSGTVNTALPNPIRVKVVDSQGVALVGKEVKFFVSPSATLGSPITTTDSNGYAATTLTFGSVSGNYIITATSDVTGNNNVSITQYAAPVTTTPTATPAPNIRSLQLVSGQNQSADVNTALTSPIVVKVIDGSGTGVQGVAVNFYVSPTATLGTPIATTDANGLASTTLTLGSISGNYIVSATANVAGNNNVSISEYANVVVGPTPTPAPTATPGANIQSLQLVSGQNQSATVNTALANPIRVRVIDGSGNGVPNKAVNFFVSPSGTLSSSVVNTDASGNAQVNLTLGSTAGAYVVTVTSDVLGNNNLSIAETAVALPVTATPTPIPGVSVQSLRLISGQNQSALVNTALTNPIRVQVINEAGVGVSGKVISFFVSPAGTLSSSSVTTDANGFAQTSLSFGSTSGNYVVTATADVIGNNNLSISEYADAAPVQTIKKIKTLLLVSGFNQSGTTGTTLAPLVVRGLDENSQVVVGASVSFNITSGSGSFNQASALTDANGNAQAVFTLPQVAGLTQGTVSVSADATVQPVQFSYAATAGITNSLILVSGGNQTGNVDSYLTQPIIIQSRDQFGNAVPNVTLSLSSNRGDGFYVANAQVTQVTTNSSGLASFQVLINGIEGARQITATTSGASIQIAAQGVIPATRPDRLVMVSGNNQKAKAGTALPLPFKVQVLDITGNPAPGYVVSFSTTNGTFGGTVNANVTATTDSSGIATSPILTLGNVSEDFLVSATTNLPGTPKSLLFNVTSLASGANDGLPVISANVIGARFNVAPSVVIWDNKNPNKMIFAGSFSTYNGTAVGKIARVDINGVLDLTFNPNSGVGFTAGSEVKALTQDENGLLYAAGSFTTYNGVSANRIIRLLNNGLKDDSFNFGTGAGSGFNNIVNTLLYDTQSKTIYAGGAFTTYKTSSTAAVQIARIFTTGSSSGSLDTSFSTSLLSSSNVGSVAKIIFDNKGRIVVATSSTPGILRLNSNGSLDNSFNFGYGFSSGSVLDIAIDSFGKIIAGGSFTTYNRTQSIGRIVRLNEDGTIDQNFSNQIGSVGFDGQVNAIKVLPISGKIVVGGSFTSYNSVAARRIAVLSYNGQLDPSFASGVGFLGTGSVNFLSEVNENRFVILGSFTGYSTYTTVPNVIVLQLIDPTLGQYQLIVNKFGGGSGNVSTTLSTGAALNCGTLCAGLTAKDSVQVITAFADAQSEFVGWSGACAGTTGNICTVTVSSNTTVSAQFKNIGTTLGGRINPYFNPAFGFSNLANANIVNKEGDNLVIGGAFTQYNGYNSQQLIRLLPDGTIDPTLPIGTGFNGEVKGYVKDAAGNYIVVGAFTSYKGGAANRIARILPSGTLDSTFTASSVGFDSTVESIILNSDGTMYVAGSFNRYLNILSNGIVHINANGSINANWKNNSSFLNRQVSAIVKKDSSLYALSGNKIYRVSLIGITDVTFDSVTFNGSLNSIEFDQYGKILVGGNFTSHTNLNSQTVPSAYIARLNNDGSIDQSFTDSLQLGFNGPISDLKIQKDGKIVVAGSFTSFNGSTASALLRLNANGLLDSSFYKDSLCKDPTSSCTASVYAISENDNEIVAVGSFSNFDYNGLSTKASNIAIIYKDAIQSLPTGQVLVSIDPSSGNKITDSQSKINCGNGSTACAATFTPGNVTFNLTLTSDYTFERWEESCIGQSTTSCVLPVVAGQTYSVSARVRYIGTTKPGELSNSFSSLDGFDSVPQNIIKDGSNLVVAGSFSSYNGTSVSKVVRLDQDGNIDTSFNAPNFDGAVTKLIIRSTPNGNIYYAVGQFRKANGINVEGIVALNNDGSILSTFKFVSGTTGFYPNDALIDKNDKLVVIGYSSSFSTGIMLRNNADTGSIDTTFVSSIGSQATNQGRLVEDAARSKYYVLFQSTPRVVLVNQDGSIDNSFSPGSGFNNTVNQGIIDSFGKLIVVGQFTSYNNETIEYIARLNFDGSLDRTFISPLGFGFDGTVNGIKLLSNGKVVVWGPFSTFYNTQANLIAVLNPDGTIASNYYNTDNKLSQTTSSISDVYEKDGQLYLAGSINYNGQSQGNIIALNPVPLNMPTSYFLSINNKTFNSQVTVSYASTSCGATCIRSFAPGASVTLTMTKASDVDFLGWEGACASAGTNPTCTITMNKNQYVAARSKYNGTNQENQIDRYFSPVLGFTTNPQWVKRNGSKILVGTSTDPSYYDGTKFKYVVQINRDGSIDKTFTSNFNIDQAAQDAITVGSNIYIGGSFTTVNGTLRRAIAKLNQDGTIVPAFTSPFTTSNSLLVSQMVYDNATNGIYVTGQGITGTVQRVNATTGQIDSSFSSPITDVNGGIGRMALAPDGKLYVAYASANLVKIIRLNANGSVDQSYSSNLSVSLATIEGIQLDSFGHILMYGNFNINGSLYKNLLRFNSDGSIDTTFLANIGSGADGSVEGVEIMPDGKILLAGSFVSFNTFVENYMIRINYDGTPDTTFSSGAGFNAPVSGLVAASDGLIAVGSFTTYKGNYAPNIVLLSRGSLVVNTVTLSVAKSGNGVGSVAGGSISCGTTCSQVTTKNTAITLTATPDATSEFVGWTEGCLPASSLTCSLTMSQNTAVTAQFRRIAGIPNSLNPIFRPALGIGEGIIQAAVPSTETHRVIIAGSFNNYGGQPVKGMTKLLENGSIDSSFTNGFDTSNGSEVTHLLKSGSEFYALNPTSRVYSGQSHYGIVKITSSGALVPGFLANINNIADLQTTQRITSLNLDLNGNLLIGLSSFSSTYKLIRVLPTGVLDTTFVSPNFNGQVLEAKFDSTNYLWVRGNFNTVNAQASPFVVKLTNLGSIATAITAITEIPNTLAVYQADNSVYFGFNGYSSFTYGGYSVKGLLKLTASGTVVASFQTNLGAGFNGPVSSLALDGANLMIAGEFSTLNNTAVPRGIIRVNSTGNRDTSFNLGSGILSGTNINLFSITAPDKFLLTGSFININGFSTSGAAKIQ